MDHSLELHAFEIPQYSTILKTLLSFSLSCNSLSLHVVVLLHTIQDKLWKNFWHPRRC